MWSRPSGATTAIVRVALAAVLAAGCSGGGEPSAVRQKGEPTFTVDPDGILRLVDDPTEPYGVTAIDYHFHDAHPTLPLSPDRAIIVTNEGRVRHNVSIPGTDFTKDIAPGESVVLRAVGTVFGGSGSHVFVCAYHVNLGMKGTALVEGG